MKEAMNVVDRMQELLEAERAGVTCLGRMAENASDAERNALFVRFRNDEGRFCAGLHRLISARGAAPTTAVGTFAEKVRLLPTENDQVALLVRGQAWVVRRIDEIAPEALHPDELAFFAEMRDTHDRNIAECRRLMH
jgi:Domain of unknown function (DUF6306)